MSDEVWPDVEGGVRDFLRADAAVVAAVGTRVFFSVPGKPTYPLVTVARVGGGETPGSTAPVDNALLSITCIGVIGDNGKPHWQDLGAVVNAVRSALGRIDGRTALTTGVDAFGAQVAGVVRAPDPADGRPRYVLTVEVTAMATTP